MGHAAVGYKTAKTVLK